ncbi:helix-turn-helix domain-containing protein [Lactococcus formosensis]|uniref:Helix-turn-helix domain-containing protein n=1 Tax=Lactococcus formosensis TaxID=1281486 RepID=A0A9X4P0J2_9LACT|nr:helix-turn-helix transcriptional regulator [Lactococcus formosensis]MDG6115391.1 helix-turn-helix domain-containing protein [Lactococcus formosensis]MDG6138930.1 helix-turn-helix domain-containing protein [Lactococcus formosensis]MDG6146286.1 helix-turn-helix domain-containing protein [Lactococcus formosensis]MDG6177792.1 helix-turn-helix domain-containing protein [Lactococcus formosensis]
MSGHLGNKEIMAENLKRYMNKYGLDRNDIAEIAGVSYFTVRDWLVARTYPRIDKIERLANHWNISKADLVEPESERPKPPTPLVEEITKISSGLDEPRQQVVLNTAKEQHKEQEAEKVLSLSQYKLSDEYLEDQINKASAYGGGELSDNDKEFFKRLLKNTLQERIDRGE